MPTNADFLRWIHERLEHTHGENPNFDYMRKLRRLSEGQIGAGTLQEETDDVPLEKGQRVRVWNNPPRDDIEPHKLYACFHSIVGDGRFACKVDGSGRVEAFDHAEASNDAYFRNTASTKRYSCEIGGSGKVQWFDHVEAFSDSEPARPSPHPYQSRVTIALAAQGDVTIQVPAGVGKTTIGDDNLSDNQNGED